MDDDKRILQSLSEALKLEGYSVDTAEKGQEAIEKAKDQFFNLALLDIRLTDMEGTDLLRMMSKASPRTTKIMITGYPTVQNAIESLNEGADAYLTKPIDPRELLKVIEEKLTEQEEAEKIGLEKVKRWIEAQVERNTRSLTERQKVEEEKNDLIGILDSYNQLLEESNRLLEQSNVDLENYAYVVSHDLKAPLRTIRSFSAFLLEDYRNRIDATGQDYLRRIAKAAESMNALIDDLLLLSRVGRKFTKTEKVDLNTLLAEIVADLKPIVESRKAEVVVDKLPTICTQKVWIKQLFMNLIDNGLKFNKSEIPRVAARCDTRKQDYLFSVSDNGIGIEKRHLTRIFNLFERLHGKEEYEGTGAGLAICKRIVENLGGRIWVESMPGEGSTFFFTVPNKPDCPENEESRR